MNVDQYLERINSLNFKENTLQGLCRLQQNHLLNIPFENLDIHLGKSIETSLDKIYEKIIVNKRGGICCELNYLFSWLLKELGYIVNILSCQIKKDDNEWTQWDTHCVLMVHMNESCFLVDVGFTQNYRTPIKFVVDKIQLDVTGCYKITKYKEQENVFTLNKCLNFDETKKNEWIPVYRFNSTPKQSSDFYTMIKLIESNNDDNFRFHDRSLCVIHTTYTVLNLVGYRLSEIKFSNSIKKSSTHSILTKTEVFDAIKNIYGISLGDNEQFDPKGD